MLKGDEQRLTKPRFDNFIVTLFFFNVFHINTVTLGDKHNRIRKGKVLLLHDERNGIAATVAAEAMIQAFLRRDSEGRCPFRMERAQPHQRRASPCQTDVRL